MTLLDARESAAGSAGRPRSPRRHVFPASLKALSTAADILVGLLFAILAHGLQAEVAWIAVCYLVGFRWAGLHRSRLNPSLLEELPRLLGVMLGATGVVLSWIVLVGDGRVPERFVHIVAFQSLGVVLGRAAVYSLVRQARATRLVAHRTLIVGCDEVSADLVSALQTHPEYGLSPIGYLDDHEDIDADALALPLLGGLSRLPDTIVEQAAEAVVVVFPHTDLSVLMSAMRRSGRMSAQLFVVPRLFDVHTQHYLGDSVRGIPLIRLHPRSLNGPQWYLKRGLDILGAGTGLLLAAPLMAVLALLVRYEGGPGVLFRQERIGRDGRPFEVLKFRSLRPVDEHESATRWNVAHDDRLGPIGRIMRKASLDELPQLWNVLRGDMSLVGPRPERPHFVSRFCGELPDYTHRHRMPTGVTGWAAVNGLRGDTSISDRARYDNYYIENWSLWLDVSILLRTIAQVFRGSGG
jgi:exopolysaccharide biosynthesis polyprenyl glycosylphosphotransferase